MKITMVARDVAPSKALDLVKKELLTKGVDVSAYLGNGKPFAVASEIILKEIKTSDLVLLGMSSLPELAKEELLAANEAIRCGVPYGFYADLYGCANRSWFENVRANARFVFSISEEEAEKIRLIFPNAEIVASGNPVLEGAFFPSKSYEQVRKEQNIQKDELLIYCTAGKDLESNRIHFQGLVEAVSSFSDQNRWQIFFMLHPGDRNDPNAYADFTKAYNIKAKLVCSDKSPALSPLDVIVACDFMSASCSTSGIEAACQRKPVADFLHTVVVKRLLEQTGSDRWYPCELGISRPVMGSSMELANAMRDLLFGDGFKEMRARQEICFPAPKMRGVVVRVMADNLVNFSK